MQEHLQVYQRTGEPCPRCGRPIKRIVVGARSTHFCSWCQRLRPADRKGAAAILRTMTGGPRRAGRRWTELARGGDARADPDEAAAGRRASTDRADETRRRHPPRGRAGSRRRRDRRPDEHPAADGRHPRGRHVRHPRRHRCVDRRSATGSGSSDRTARARRRCCGSRPGATSPTVGEVHRKRGLTLGLLAQEAHFDEAFMASPDLRLAVRTGAAHLDRMAERLAAMERDGTVTEPRLCGAPPPVRDPRRLHAGPAGRERADRARLHPRRVGQAALSAVRRRADAGVAGPAGHRRSRPAAARRAHQPSRPRRARMARGAPPPAERARCSSRRTTARSSTPRWTASGSSATGA